jgi:hypothetical protein
MRALYAFNRRLAAYVYVDSAKIQVFGLVKHFAFKTFLQQTDFERVIGLNKCLLSIK